MNIVSLSSSCPEDSWKGNQINKLEWYSLKHPTNHPVEWTKAFHVNTDGVYLWDFKICKWLNICETMK